MLDIFMVCFILLATYLYLLQLSRKTIKNDLIFYLSAVSWGFAIAVKWSAIFTFIPFTILMSYQQLRFLKNKKLLSYNIKKNLLYGVIPLLIYFITFLPYLFVEGPYKSSLFDIVFKMPIQMYHLQQSVSNQHSYRSSWITWPFMLRPIWYEYLKAPLKESSFQGVMLLGNPLQMFLGLISTLLLLFRWEIIKPYSKSFLILFVFSWITWSLFQGRPTFFYYFFPSAIIYSFLVPMALEEIFERNNVKKIMLIFVVLSALLFYYFYPILSGTISPEKIRLQWYWMSGWI